MRGAGAPRKIPKGMKYMLAITWSVPRPTKHITGNQIETIFEMISRDDTARKTAMQTSQLPVRVKIVSLHFVLKPESRTFGERKVWDGTYR